MKTFVKIFAACAALTFSLASCNLNDYPVFNPEDSFAYFVKATANGDETIGSINIPVSIAALENQQVNVSFKINDGTAKKDVDFRVSGDGVLRFDGKSDTQNVVIEVLPHLGEFTGDLSFSVEIVSAGDLKIGDSNVCNVTIQDIDHPLASILGEYAASGTSSYDGAMNWTTTFYKDASDVTVIWIEGVTRDYNNASMRVYANVMTNEEGEVESFTIPAGQYVPYNASYDLWLVGNKAGSGSYYPSAPLTWAQTSKGVFTLVAEADAWDSIGVLAVSKTDHSSIAGWWERFDVPPTFTKK